MALAKFFISFALSFSILCIPVSGKPLFNHLQKWASPYAQEAIVYLKDLSHKGWEQTKKLFSNSTPQMQDSIRSTFSHQKRVQQNYSTVTVDSDGETQDSYTKEEQELLNKVLSKEK